MLDFFIGLEEVVHASISQTIDDLGLSLVIYFDDSDNINDNNINI